MSSGDQLVLQPDSLWVSRIRPILLTLLETTNEIGRLFPDSIIFGSFLLFFMTQNLPYGIFALFMIETSVLHKVTSFLFDKTSGGASANSKSTRNTDASCIPGFRRARIEFERTLLGNSYPSSPMFFLGAIASYLALVNTAFKETMDEMGKDWSSRYWFGAVMIVLWCGAAIGLRGLTGCTSFGEIGLAFFIGIMMGVGLYFVNTRLFGMEAVNFLGLPYLVNKTDEKNPLYVCTKGNGLV
jgi:hypothetical protein